MVHQAVFSRMYNIERCVQNILCSNGSRMTWCRHIHIFKKLKGHRDITPLKCQVQVSRENINLRIIFQRLMQNSSLSHTNHFHSFRKLFKIKRDYLTFLKRGYASLHQVDDGLLLKYLESLDVEYNEILESYMKGIKTQGKDINARRVFLAPLVNVFAELKEKYKEMEELKQLGAEDAEMKSMAEDEVEEIKHQIDNMKLEILGNLVPDLKYDKNDVLLELNPGVGGEEAKLFTLDMYEMYARYAAYKGWTFSTETLKQSDNGGLSKVQVFISGYDVFKWMKYESGIHRVQRIPKTERGGRVHTSTATVAILPKPNEIDITIEPKDLQIDTFRAGGAGGQHVNTTDSAVRVTHIPSGIVTNCQEDRSQISNRKTAIDRLRTRLYEKEFNAQMSQITSQRKLQVGTAGRSEKIRTYNFAQNRVTDHRIHYSSTDLLGILKGGHILDDFIQKLQEESRKESLVEMLEEFKAKNL